MIIAMNSLANEFQIEIIELRQVIQLMEFHQLFVPGRGGQVTDVLIDSAGAVIGIGIYAAVLVMVKKRIKKY